MSEIPSYELLIEMYAKCTIEPFTDYKLGPDGVVYLMRGDVIGGFTSREGLAYILKRIGEQQASTLASPSSTPETDKG